MLCRLFFEFICSGLLLSLHNKSFSLFVLFLTPTPVSYIFAVTVQYFTFQPRSISCHKSFIGNCGNFVEVAMCQLKHKLTADIVKEELNSAEYILLKNNKGTPKKQGNSRSVGIGHRTSWLANLPLVPYALPIVNLPTLMFSGQCQSRWSCDIPGVALRCFGVPFILF